MLFANADCGQSYIGISQATPNRTYDMANDEDEEYTDFGLFITRKEYKSIRRCTLRGRISSAKEGHFVGGTPPFGYDKVWLEMGRAYTNVPNHESEAVKLIFAICISGGGLHENSKAASGIPEPPYVIIVRTLLSHYHPEYCGSVQCVHHAVAVEVRHAGILALGVPHDIL